jgi:hypothetical protein
MLGFGALGELPLADFGTPDPGTYLSLPAIQINAAVATVGFRGGRNLDLTRVEFAASFTSIGVQPGKLIGLPNVTFSASAKLIAPLPGKSLNLPFKALGLAFGTVDIQTGRIFNLADTFTKITDVGALGEGTLGEFAIGEGAPISIAYTRPVRLSLNVQALGVLPGKNIDLSPLDILFDARPVEVDARGRRIRINAIAS